MFCVEGDRDEVLAFLGDICAALEDLPLERLETEREVLRAEASSFSPGLLDRLLTMRFGASAYGVASSKELGIDWVDAEAAELMEILRGLCSDGPDEADLADAVTLTTKALEDSRGVVRALDYAATSELERGEHLTPQELIDAYGSVTSRDIGTVLTDFLGAAVATTAGDGPPPAGFHGWPDPIREKFEGRQFRAGGVVKQPRLVVGDTGLRRVGIRRHPEPAPR